MTKSDRRPALLWPLLVCVVTAGYAAIPYVVAPYFYQRGDTAAQFAPTWFHLGDMVRNGVWPTWLDPSSWQGGNYVAEALFGIYDPLNIPIWLALSAASSLMVATFLVKAAVLVVLALGVYLLAREYGSARWAAAVVATIVPFGGYTLFWDAGSWPSGLIAFAYTPWVWWIFRRYLRGRAHPLLAFVIGVLAITQGNPYGILGLAVVGVAVVIEGLVEGRRAAALRLIALGVCVAAFLPLVYVPLLDTSSLTVRAVGPLFANNGKLRPTIGDLLGLGAPTFVPGIRAITGPMAVPATYFSWMVLPLLPWLRFDLVRRRWRELVGIGVVTVVFVLLTIGPSKLWLFRWPLRLVEYGYLGLAIAFGLLLTEGLRRDRVRLRAGASAALVLVGVYFSWAQSPSELRRGALGALLLLAGAAVLLTWHRLRPQASTGLAVLCILGTGVVLASQVLSFGENASSRYWHTPSNVAQLRSDFSADQGLTLQFANLKPLQNHHQYGRLRKAWADFLPGSLYHVAGVEAVNNYTGMGYRVFGRRLCMTYDGLAQQCGYRNVWQPVGNGTTPLIDLLKVETVVVQQSLVPDGVPAPQPGWTVVRHSNESITMRRDAALSWPGSRLSFASPGIDVATARSVGETGEDVQLRSASHAGRLVFAMLSWPGYRASLDGHPVAIKADRVGLLTVAVPAGSHGLLHLTYRPPRLVLCLVVAGAGILGALALTGWSVLDRRRRRTHRDLEQREPVTG